MFGEKENSEQHPSALPKVFRCGIQTSFPCFRFMGAVDEKTVRPPLMDANQRGVMSLSIQVLNDQCCAKGFRCYEHGRQCRLGATLHLNSSCP